MTKRSKATVENKSSKSTLSPTDVMPMLATLVSHPIEEEGWIYEVKWDGYRALGYMHNGVAEIRSRNNKVFTEKYYPIAGALRDWGIDAIVDGELVVLLEKGIADFSSMQNWRSEADGHLVYYVFDLLWYDGRDLMNEPLHERREILEELIEKLPAGSPIKLSEQFDTSGKEFFALADKMGLEGIMAKRLDSIYVPDHRSKDWLKIKTEKRQEAVIGGYTRNEGTSKPFSALLLGIYEGKRFVSMTPVGTGFSVKQQREILDRLKPLQIDESPFDVAPEFNKPSRFRPNPPPADVVWVKPEIVCEISYREKTPDGNIRHPSFKGIREDKKAKEVVWEIPIPPPIEKAEEKKSTANKKGKQNVSRSDVIAKVEKGDRRTLLNPTEETQVKEINGHPIKFTNLSKLYWPEDKVSKRDMLNFYYQMAPVMLPYYKGKPQTLNRFPNGIHGKTFYQKDVKGKAPGWIETFPYYSHMDQRDKEFLVITNEASILHVAGMGCIEINPWNSRVSTPDNPDWCIIDLDPDKNTFDQVIECANVTKQVLDAIGVPAYPKTSGSTGMHIYIPLGAKYTYEHCKEFGRVIAKIIHAQLPEYTSIERLVANRGGKMYIDFLQNRPQATVAGPYSLRPKPGAPVSTPLDWSEVKKGLKITDHNIHNVVHRVKEIGDIFKPVMGKGIDLKSTLKKIEIVFGMKWEFKGKL